MDPEGPSTNQLKWSLRKNVYIMAVPNQISPYTIIYCTLTLPVTTFNQPLTQIIVSRLTKFAEKQIRTTKVDTWP